MFSHITNIAKKVNFRSQILSFQLKKYEPFTKLTKNRMEPVNDGKVTQE